MLIRKTEKELIAPIERLCIYGWPEGHVSNLSAVGLFEAVKNGENVYDTEYYKQLVEKSTGEEDLRLRLESFRDRVRSSAENKPIEAPLVKLCANGNFEIEDGHHRAAQAFVRGLENIPVKVTYISPLWQWLEDELKTLNAGQKALYEPIEHPYFDDWRLFRGRQRRADIIAFLKRFTHPKGSTHLDIGCCTGWICRGLRSEGFVSVGLDKNPACIRIAAYLDWICHSQNSYLCDVDVIDLLDMSYPARWRVITCMSMLHHYTRDPEKFESTAKRIADQSEIFFLDLAGKKDDIAHRPLGYCKDWKHYKGFIDWFREKLECKSVSLVGIHEGRPLFAASQVMEWNSETA